MDTRLVGKTILPDYNLSANRYAAGSTNEPSRFSPQPGVMQSNSAYLDSRYGMIARSSPSMVWDRTTHTLWLLPIIAAISDKYWVGLLVDRPSQTTAVSGWLAPMPLPSQ